jgi:hypothetical protein
LALHARGGSGSTLRLPEEPAAQTQTIPPTQPEAAQPDNVATSVLGGAPPTATPEASPAPVTAAPEAAPAAAEAVDAVEEEAQGSIGAESAPASPDSAAPAADAAAPAADSAGTDPDGESAD